MAPSSKMLTFSKHAALLVSNNVTNRAACSVRCISSTSMLLKTRNEQQQGSDPIQALFLQKVRDYEQKKRAAGGKLVDASPEQQKQLDEEMARLLKQYGGNDESEMKQYPKLTFKESKFDPIASQVEGEKQEIDPEVIRKELLAMKRSDDSSSSQNDRDQRRQR